MLILCLNILLYHGPINYLKPFKTCCESHIILGIQAHEH